MKKIFLIWAFSAFLGLNLYGQDDPMQEKEKKNENTEDSDSEESDVFKKRDNPQNPNEPSWRDKVFFGGNFWLQFGNVTYVEIAPIVGYRLTPQLQVGAGVSYQYYRVRDFFNMNGGLSTSTYGGRAFGRYFLYSNLFLHAEAEALNLPYVSYLNVPSGELVRGWVPALLGGGGYSFPIGQRGALQMTILYNVLWERNRSFNASPWVTRMGFTF